MQLASRFTREEGRRGRKDLATTKQVVVEGRMREHARPRRVLQKGKFEPKKSLVMKGFEKDSNLDPLVS